MRHPQKLKGCPLAESDNQQFQDTIAILCTLFRMVSSRDPYSKVGCDRWSPTFGDQKVANWITWGLFFLMVNWTSPPLNLSIQFQSSPLKRSQNNFHHVSHDKNPLLSGCLIGDPCNANNPHRISSSIYPEGTTTDPFFHCSHDVLKRCFRLFWDQQPQARHFLGFK